MDTKTRIRDFVRTNFVVDPNLGDIDNLPLLESGILDSTGVLELVLFIKGEFKTLVPAEDIIPENFDSITRLADYVDNRLPIAV